jgi:hypothetical protein
MSVNISIGSIVSGKSGKSLKVLAVNGDVLEVLGDAGSFKVRRSAILKVIPPRPAAPHVLKLGDRVTYIGSDLNLKTQYAGTLEIWKISKNPYDGYTCLKPNGRTTSWVQFEDLELAIKVNPNMTGLEGDLWV